MAIYSNSYFGFTNIARKLKKMKLCESDKNVQFDKMKKKKKDILLFKFPKKKIISKALLFFSLLSSVFKNQTENWHLYSLLHQKFETRVGFLMKFPNMEE